MPYKPNISPSCMKIPSKSGFHFSPDVEFGPFSLVLIYSNSLPKRYPKFPHKQMQNNLKLAYHNPSHAATMEIFIPFEEVS